jgi:transcriptional regulator with XRE-family HTH domain
MKQEDAAARSYEPTPIGLRVARERVGQGLSASGLADRINDPAITRAVITNIERGRKPDPTVSEIVKIAFGLNLSPLELIVDVENPFAPLDLHRLTGPLSEMSGLEYARYASIFSRRGDQTPAFDSVLEKFIEGLISAETARDQYRFVQHLLEAGNPNRDMIYGGMTSAGEAWQLYGSSITHEGLENLAHQLVAAYRLALGQQVRDRRARGERGPLATLPEPLQARLEALRVAVVDVLAVYPDADFAVRQSPGDVNPATSMPRLDPLTGLVEQRPSPNTDG